MSYIIQKADGTAVTVSENIADADFFDASTNRGIHLIGRGTVNYGAAFDQNFVQLMENFSSGVVPLDATALQGQLWFKKISDTNGELYVRTSGSLTGGEANWKKLILPDESGAVSIQNYQSIIGNLPRLEFHKPGVTAYLWEISQDNRFSLFASNGSGVPVGSALASFDQSGTFYTRSIQSSGTITGSNLSGNNTGDQTITLTGDVTGSGTGSFVSTLKTMSGVTAASYVLPTISVDTKGRVTAIANGTVTWTAVQGKPTTAAALGIDDLATTSYVDVKNYLNFSPLAGILDDNIVPVGADFKYSLGRFSSTSFTWKDREDKQVVFYASTSPTAQGNIFRAFRYSEDENFIFDNDPVHAPFLTSGEKVYAIQNMGTFFAVLYVVDVVGQARTRLSMVRTYGSSDWHDWTLAYDLLPIAGEYSNFALVPTTSGDRILKMVIRNSPEEEFLEVYDSSLTLLRSLKVVTATETTTTDLTGAGRVVQWPPNLTSYSTGKPNPFTWNPLSETLHQSNGDWGNYIQNGSRVGYHISRVVSWDIPKSWIQYGTGTPVNRIPMKPSGFRYEIFPATSWGADGGTLGYGGQAPAITTDEYSGQMYVTVKGTWDTAYVGGITKYSFDPAFKYTTIEATPTRALLGFSPAIPDASYWGKATYMSFASVIGNNIVFDGYSVAYGSNRLQTTFSTSSFGSVSVPNDTLKLNAPGAILWGTQTPAGADLGSPGHTGCTVLGTGPVYYLCVPGKEVFTVTASGVNRTYTSAGISVPVIPASIGAVTGVVFRSVAGWNGSVGSPVFWALVADSARALHMAKCVAGTWSIVSSNLYQDILDSGNSNRGDTAGANQFWTESPTLITESGMLLSKGNVSHTGGTAQYWIGFNTGTNVHSLGGVNDFAAPGAGPTPYTGSGGGYGGVSFGYSSTLGYFCVVASSSYTSAAFVCSRDVRTGATITESQWFNTPFLRYVVNISAESATGLVAYISEYPIFLGGYYGRTPNTSVSLLPNAENYVYANRTNTTTISITSSTNLLTSSFSRVLLSKITTNNERITSQVNYPVKSGTAGDLPLNNLSDVNIFGETTGQVLKYDGGTWINGALTAADVGAVPVGGTAAGAVFEIGRYLDFHHTAGTDYDVRLEVQSVNGTGGGSLYCHASAGFTCSGNVSAFSDANLKTDLVQIPEALSKVLDLTGYTYTRLDSGLRQTGLIAQDLQKVLPEAVETSGEFLAIAYGNVVGLLVEAIKELKAEIDLRDKKQGISMRQFRLSLLKSGYLEFVENLVPTLSKELQIDWAFADTVLQDSPLVLSITEELGLKPEAIADLFELALTL